MNKVISILMRRDSLTEAEARALCDECLDVMEAENFVDGDDTMREILGLEPDYIFDLMELRGY